MAAEVLLLVVGVLLYPLMVLVLVVARAGVRRGLRFLLTCNNVALGVDEIVATQLKELGFGVTLTGATLEIAASTLFAQVVPAPVLMTLLSYHLVLAVAFAAGLGLFRIARRRLLLFFLGETLGSSAVVAGSFLLIYVIYILTPGLGLASLIWVVVIVAIFLSVVSVRFMESAELYATAARDSPKGGLITMTAVCTNNHKFAAPLTLDRDALEKISCPRCHASLTNVICKKCETCVPPYTPCRNCKEELFAVRAC